MKKSSAQIPKVLRKHQSFEESEPVGEQSQPQNLFPIVGIGASAGGLEAFTQLLGALPNDTGMAFVLIQHLDPGHESHLTELLAKATTMPVCEVKNGMTVKPNHVFVIPPNTNLGVVKGKLKLTPRDVFHGPHFPVDFLFHSLAKEQQSWAIGVVLSGTGSDGAAGLAEIKNCGGLTFAQDEKSAKFSGMPQQAANANVDFILSPEKIAEELARLGRDPYLVLPPKTAGEELHSADAKDFERILAILRSHTNVDLSQYRDATIRRRIQRRMVVHTRHTLADYIKLLEKDSGEVKLLFDDALINVTSFFRDPEMFEALKAEVFPELLKAAPQVIRVWVTACSTGQEAYSMAIALLEVLESREKPPAIQIFATDVNELVSIEKARRGFFPDRIEIELSPERLRRFFTKEEGGYRISKAIRDVCIFAKQNLASDPPFSRMDLVSCRNVLIYFTPELQRRVISTFHYALKPTGYLVLGGSETVGANSDLFEPLNRKHKIFSKKGMAVRPFAHFMADDLKPGTLAAARGETPYAPGTADFQKESDRILLGRYAPAAVLVNSSLEVLQFRGRTSAYLEPPTGPASFNLLKMARDNLPLELGKVIQEARRKNVPVRSHAHLHDNDSIRKINLEVVPLKLTGSAEICFLVLFEETGKEIAENEKIRRKKKEIADAKRPVAEKDRELAHLRRDLAAAREYLQSVVEQHNASSEELKCANEEVLSSNEELQSTNEQLGTAKEELQSLNEELVTLNEELQTSNTDLIQTAKDDHTTARDVLQIEKNARHTAETATMAKDDFLAALSHELRTPLNPVLLIASDAVKNRDLPPSVRADFEIIRKNIELEARLIDDLLDLTRIVNGKVALNKETVDMHKILQDALTATQAELDDKEIKITINLKAKRHTVHGDAMRLQQVFWNVAKNAVKFTPAGGKIGIETSVSANNTRFSVKITDTGMGMTREELAGIFSTFWQGDHAKNESHRFGGLGLGLAICKKLVEFHAGTIKAESAGRNCGAAFTIELPLMTSSDEKNSSKAQNRLAEEKKSAPSGGQILLVEDHEPTRNALASLLVRRKYKVTPAGSLAEARTLAEKASFDFVISDIGLPDGSGNDLMAELLDRHGLKGIALTGYGMEEDVKRCLASGFVAHLTKPVTIQALESALTRLARGNNIDI